MSILQKVPARKLAVVGVITLALYPLAIMAARVEIWHFRNSFLVMILAALLGFAALVFALLKLSRSAKQDTKPLIITLVSTALPLFILGNSIMQAQGVPMIHDISTDTSNVPALIAAQSARVDGDHAVDYEGAELAAAQMQAYPHIKPLTLSMAPLDVLTKAKAIAVQNGWEILAVNDSELPYTLEAVDTSLLFAFKDDVVVRINQIENTTQVDMRSMSRLGKSDLGKNAQRIDAFLSELSGQN